MKTTLALALAVLSVVSAVAQDSGGAARKQPADLSFIYAHALPRILRESRIPPKLPTQFTDIDREHPIDVNVVSVRATGYELILGLEPGCEGGNACRYGSVFGSSKPLKDLGEGKWETVTLARGIRGQYLPTECHAMCTDAYVRWRQGGFWYAVGLKAANKRDVVRAANSAIVFAGLLGTRNGEHISST